jgi:Fe-S oxidoreductase
MHPLIDREMWERIRETGQALAGLPPREQALERLGLPVDRPAEDVLITGCNIIHLLPGEISALAGLMERAGRSFTLLAREYCCGNYLYRPAIAARDEAALAECRELSRELLAMNLERARELGARRLVIFCSPCYPLYRASFPGEDIVFYPRILLEMVESGELGSPQGVPGTIDYYAGCYRLHRKLADVPMDLEAVDSLLSLLPGLEVNRISAPRCCYTEEGLRHLKESSHADLLLTVCTGCYGQALNVFPPGGRTEVIMLPSLLSRIFQA